QHVGRRIDTAEVGGPRGTHAAVDTLRPAQPEFHDGVIAGGMAYTRGLGRDQGLKIDQVQQGRFEQLALDDRPAYTQQRLVGENGRALRDGVHVAGELERGEVVQKALTEQRLPVVAAYG